MSVRWFEGAEALRAAAPDWTRLSAESASGTPYQSLPWLEAWLAHRGAGVSPRIALVDDAVLAPLGRVQRLGARTLVLLGSPDSDYAGLVSMRAPDEAWRAIAAAIDSASERFDLIHLHSVAQPDAIESALREQLGRPVYRRAYEPCPWIDTDRPFEALLAERGRELRKNVRRWARRMEEGGGLALDVRPPGLASEEIRELEEVERASWKWERGDAMLRPGPQRRFLETVLCDPRAPLRLWRLRSGGALVAFAVVLEDPRRWYFFLSSFRRDAGHAGAHLLARIVEAACEAPVAALDLLRGDFDYKRAWTDRADWVHEIVCPLRPRGHAAALLFAARWRAARSERIRRLRARLLGAGDRR